MFKNLMDFAGYRTLALISTLFFFAMFAGIVIRVMFMKKTHVTEMSNLPLEGNSPPAQQKEERP
jgi:hypothetical protein